MLNCFFNEEDHNHLISSVWSDSFKTKPSMRRPPDITSLKRATSKLHVISTSINTKPNLGVKVITRSIALHQTLDINLSIIVIFHHIYSKLHVLFH